MKQATLLLSIIANLNSKALCPAALNIFHSTPISACSGHMKSALELFESCMCVCVCVYMHIYTYTHAYKCIYIYYMLHISDILYFLIYVI